jgi:hypothetical protein
MLKRVSGSSYRDAAVDAQNSSPGPKDRQLIGPAVRPGYI